LLFWIFILLSFCFCMRRELATGGGLEYYNFVH
jgi:hypothetical protein